MATFIEVNTTDYANVFTIKTNMLANPTGYEEAHIMFDEIVDVALIYQDAAVKVIRKYQRELYISVFVQESYMIIETIDGISFTNNRDMMEFILNKIWP